MDDGSAGSSRSVNVPDYGRAGEPFVFIPFSGEEAATGRKASSAAVRAHVTRLQHARSQRRNPMQVMQTWTVAASTPRATSSRTRSDKSRSTPSDTPATSHSDEQSDDSLSVFLGSTAKDDPFWTFPVAFDSCLPRIIAHYIENLAVDIPILDGSGQTGLLRRRWFPLAMTEPATMYALLLVAAAHYYAVSPASSQKLVLLKLKSCALAEINNAMNERDHAVSDALIGAVMKMAAYEAIFGEPCVYTAHMRGLTLMLKRRGGPKSLGLDGLLERMVVWIDTNAAHLTGTKRITAGEDFPSDFSCDDADVSNFTGLS